MPIRCSRYNLFFNIILVPQLVNGGRQRFGDRQGWIVGNQLYNYPSEPDKQSPFGNQSFQQSPSYPSDCKICTISVASVSLYFWPQESTNTDCLATIPPQPSPTTPSGLDLISPSAYALFFSVTIKNDCGSTLTYPTSTASFDQSSLSTLDINDNPQSFNLADLPCPPSSVKLQAGQPYQPFFAWNHELFFTPGYEPAVCKTMVGLSGWRDPPIALPSVKGPLPAPTPGTAPRGRLRREPANAHVAPRVPAKTTAVT